MLSMPTSCSFLGPPGSGPLICPGQLEASRCRGGIGWNPLLTDITAGVTVSLSSAGVGAGVGWGEGTLTSADALLLPRQDARAVDDADALQDLIGQLGAHESGKKDQRWDQEPHLSKLQQDPWPLKVIAVVCKGTLHRQHSTGATGPGAGPGGGYAVTCHQILNC